jgi:hypothetical protein
MTGRIRISRILIIGLCAILLIYGIIYGIWKAYDRVALQEWNFTDPFPPHTEFVFANEGNHAILIHSWRLGADSEQFEHRLIPDNQAQNVVEMQLEITRLQDRYREQVEISYTDLSTGIDHHASFTADRRPRRECKFWLVIADDQSRLSECERSDREDFR